MIFIVQSILLILLILMIFNVQLEVGESSASLLEWINIERYEQGKEGSLFTFRQVLQQSSIYEILKNVDEIFFEFQNLQLHAKMDFLEKYLERQFGKRMKWGFKQSLGNFCEETHLKEFTKLVCYLSIHSKKKNQVINRILTLSQESQKFLMEHMQKVQEKLQNIMQIKEILEQMQILECQNQEFKRALEQMAKTNTQLLQFVKDCQQENKRYKDEVQKLRSEKCEVFSTLKIDYITEYLDAFTKLKNENERYFEYMNQSELKIERIQAINKQLNDRIKCDCLVINNLSQEITRLKEICNDSLIKVDYDWQRSASKNNTLKSIGRSNNKENISKCSTLGKSMQVPAEWLGLLQNEDQNLLQDKSFYKTYNHELMGKLENMYSKYNEVNDEATLLRQKNKQLKLKNKQLKRICKSVQYLQKQFEFKYKAADIEAKKTIKRLIRTND